MKISIITTTYNSAQTVADTLQSVANQTYHDIEHIIIDGASKDNTLEIVKQFPHVSKVTSEPDKGIYDAMNKGIALATGDIIGILNSDDIFENNNVVDEIMSIFNKNIEIDAIYGNISYFKTENPNKIVRYWKSKPYYSSFFEDGEVPPHPSLFVKKKVYNNIGMYKIYYKIAADHDFMFRMLKIHKFQSYFLDKIIVKMREGGVSTKGINSYLTSTKELVNVWSENGVVYPKLLFIIRPIKKIKQFIFK